jgi:hypothetical protein
MRAITLALVAVGALGVFGATGVFAGDAPPAAAALVGKDAPAIDTKEFLQSDGRTQVADFKGEVLFIECFATW